MAFINLSLGEHWLQAVRQVVKRFSLIIYFACNLWLTKELSNGFEES